MKNETNLIITHKGKHYYPGSELPKDYKQTEKPIKEKKNGNK